MTTLFPYDLTPLLAELGHTFQDSALLQAALTHPSVGGGRGVKKTTQASPYERLEFLGDRVLGLVIAQWLYALYPLEAEGELAKRHASMVNRDALREIAITLHLERFIHLAHDDTDFSRQNLAVLSDAMEAVIGALYLDGGLLPAENFIKRHWGEKIHESATPVDPKSALQEYAQGKGLPLPIYRVMERSGPAHSPSFIIEASVRGHEAVSASGASKREAEKAAAQLLLSRIGQI